MRQQFSPPPQSTVFLLQTREAVDSEREGGSPEVSTVDGTGLWIIEPSSSEASSHSHSQSNSFDDDLSCDSLSDSGSLKDKRDRERRWDGL
jgi:hypothetical protein